MKDWTEIDGVCIHNEARAEGVRMYHEGVSLNSCRYRTGSWLEKSWSVGWRSADESANKERHKAV